MEQLNRVNEHEHKRLSKSEPFWTRSDDLVCQLTEIARQAPVNPGLVQDSVFGVMKAHIRLMSDMYKELEYQRTRYENLCAEKATSSKDMMETLSVSQDRNSGTMEVAIDKDNVPGTGGELGAYLAEVARTIARTHTEIYDEDNDADYVFEVICEGFIATVKPTDKAPA